jgi:diphosphomevalonate decarboxylase
MSKPPKTVTAVACANIALIKYWGKRDPVLNLPAVGSISLTLDKLRSYTHVTFRSDLSEDSLEINNQTAPGMQHNRIQKFMNLIRQRSGIAAYAEIKSENNFPTGAGLASSASAFAALSLAASSAAELNLNDKELSICARMGSGSAARSIYGGFVEMQIGTDPQGEEDYAVQLADENYWDLRLLILITALEEKKTGSTHAMNVSAQTSPFYHDWVSKQKGDLSEMRKAISDKDFEKLGELAEHNALKMHALMFSSKPAIIYWNKTTIELIHVIQELRRSGFPVYFTIDAGPQIKVITLPSSQNDLQEKFSNIPGIQKIIATKLGHGVRLEENPT